MSSYETAIGGEFGEFGEATEFGETGELFVKPRVRATEDYIRGKFG